VYHRKVRGVDVPPEVLSAFVLDRLKRDAELRLGPIRRVVITVPAFFDETRRKATQDAAAWPAGGTGHHQRTDGRSGRLRLSAGLLRSGRSGRGGKPMRVWCTIWRRNLRRHDSGDLSRRLSRAGHGRRRAAGRQGLGRTLVDHLAGQFAAEHGLDPAATRRTPLNCGWTPRGQTHAVGTQPDDRDGLPRRIRMKIEVTRQVFHDLTRDLLERTETTTSLVIKEAGLDWPQIGRVLLVGGSIRMPMVSEMLRRVTGKEPDRTASPDEAVAQARHCTPPHS